MGGACSNLAFLSNPCDLSACTATADVKVRASASTSVQAIITLLPGTHFNGDPVTSVFVKAFIDVDSFTQELYNMFRQYVTTTDRNVRLKSKPKDVYTYRLSALEAELTFYGSFIQPIVSQRICPFFINVYSTSHNCSYNQLESIMGTNLYESFGQTLFESKDVSKITVEPDLKQALMNTNVSFGVIVSQVGGSETLKTWFDKIKSQKREIIDWFAVMFQVGWGIYVLQLAGITHNDLHLNNIFVKLYERPKTFCLNLTTKRGRYALENRFYTVTSLYKAQIFDFDRATTEWSKGGPVITGKDLCQVVFKLLLHSDTKSKNKYVMPLVDTLFPFSKESRKREMVNAASRDERLDLKTVAKDMKPIHDILDEWANLAEIYVSDTQPVSVLKEDVYSVSPDMFRKHDVKVATMADLVESNEHAAKIRDMEVFLAQEEYDLNQLQLKYRSFK